MFICGPEKEAIKRTKKLDDLKQLVEKIEEKMLIPCTMLGCPSCLPPCAAIQPPDVMVCYKYEKSEKRKKRSVEKRRKRAKSRELRASILYVGCDCEKRNGLQDDCNRTECHGCEDCLTKPSPICGPSEFSNGKHLGRNRNYKMNKGDHGSDDEGNERVNVYYNCYPAAVRAQAGATTTCNVQTQECA